ncbi:MAG: hypothetical protein COS95_07315 [Ignavibacteriales bacterium CG07_land_8_20_14_0_80_59_12]|nr:MAG: hypothetical protein COS95_07315 [Ignavibacteriales bacterium CG07_land_8_20_14_0_80_59_12]
MDQHRILVADDEETIRAILKDELEEEGYAITTAVDGEDAIRLLRQDKFDLVLADIKMPRADGFDVLRTVKAEQPSVRVIMLTGFADLKNAIESKRLGADDFVSKPYDIVDLVTTIERVLSLEPPAS